MYIRNEYDINDKRVIHITKSLILGGKRKKKRLSSGLSSALVNEDSHKRYERRLAGKKG